MEKHYSINEYQSFVCSKPNKLGVGVVVYIECNIDSHKVFGEWQQQQWYIDYQTQQPVKRNKV